jgi:histidine triad (HIT) family protein
MKTQKKDCIFCNIANGEIPSNKIYEDDDFLVMLDINPGSKGHAVLLPKNHAADLFELSDTDAKKIMLVIRTCGRAMKKVLHCDGLNILQNNGEVAGQTVFHYHVHLIPRYHGDQVQISWQQGEAKDAAKLAEEIRNAISQ